MNVHIAYLTVQMPVPSEVFLAVEINGLRAAGAQVKVFALRGRHREHARLLSDQKLEQVTIRHFPLLRPAYILDALHWLTRRPAGLARVLKVILFRCWRRPALLVRSLALVPKSLRIARIVEREKIPIVHTAWSHYPAVTALVIKELVPATHLTMAIGAYDRLSRHPLTETAANRAAYVFTQSEMLRELITREIPGIRTPIVTIARGVDLSELEAHRTTEREPGLVVTAGRLIELKGHQYLIRAIAQVRHSVPQAHLVIFGQGDYQAELERLVVELQLSDAVTFASHLSQSELFAQTARAQVFVLASRSPSENLPNSVKEAMALGLPVVTTPTTGIEELVKDGVTGYIIEAEDVDAWAARIVHLLQNEAVAQCVAKAAQEHVGRVAGLAMSSAQRMARYSEMTSRNKNS